MAQTPLPVDTVKFSKSDKKAILQGDCCFIRVQFFKGLLRVHREEIKRELARTFYIRLYWRGAGLKGCQYWTVSLYEVVLPFSPKPLSKALLWITDCNINTKSLIKFVYIKTKSNMVQIKNPDNLELLNMAEDQRSFKNITNNYFWYFFLHV